MWRSNYHSNVTNVTAGQVSFCWIPKRYDAKYPFIENERIRLSICIIVEQQYLYTSPETFYSF